MTEGPTPSARASGSARFWLLVGAIALLPARCAQVPRGFVVTPGPMLWLLGRTLGLLWATVIALVALRRMRPWSALAAAIAGACACGYASALALSVIDGSFSDAEWSAQLAGLPLAGFDGLLIGSFAAAAIASQRGSATLRAALPGLWLALVGVTDGAIAVSAPRWYEPGSVLGPGVSLASSSGSISRSIALVVAATAVALGATLAIRALARRSSAP